MSEVRVYLNFITVLIECIQKRVRHYYLSRKEIFIIEVFASMIFR